MRSVGVKVAAEPKTDLMRSYSRRPTRVAGYSGGARAWTLDGRLEEFERRLRRRNLLLGGGRAKTASRMARRFLLVGRGTKSPSESGDQAVELPRVLAGDLLDHVLRQVAELLLDVLRRLRPDAVGVGIVGRPHDRLVAEYLDALFPGADLVELERGLALALPVVTRRHREPEVAEAVLPFEVHAVDRVGKPADPALAEHDAQVRIPLEDGGTDDGREDVDEVHLERGHTGEQRGTAHARRRLLADAGRRRWERVEVQRQVHLVHGLPERLPARVVHGLHVPRARELEASDAGLRHAVRLLDGGVDVAIRQARETDEAIGIRLHELREPVVIDAEHLLRGFVVVQARGRAQDAEEHFRVDAVEILVLHAEMGIDDAPLARLGVVVETRRVHLLDAVVLAGDVLRPAGSDAAHEPERHAVLASPVRAVGAVGHVRHPVLQRRRGLP